MDMSKRLRRKFILVAMASVVVVLAGIIAAINVANYCDVCNQADARLALIQQDNGVLEDKQQPSSNDADPDTLNGDAGENGGTGHASAEYAGAQSPASDSSGADAEPSKADKQGSGNGDSTGADSAGNPSQAPSSEGGAARAIPIQKLHQVQAAWTCHRQPPAAMLLRCLSSPATLRSSWNRTAALLR